MFAPTLEGLSQFFPRVLSPFLLVFDTNMSIYEKGEKVACFVVIFYMGQ